MVRKPKVKYYAHETKFASTLNCCSEKWYGMPSIFVYCLKCVKSLSRFLLFILVTNAKIFMWSDSF